MGFIEDKSDLYFAAESGTQECKCYVSLRTIGHLKNGYTVGPRRQERVLKYLALLLKFYHFVAVPQTNLL